MYEEEIIFGPFTFRQFLILGLAAIASKLLYLYTPVYIACTLIVLIACIAIALALRLKPKKIEIKDIDSYMKNQRMKLGEKEYVRMLQRKQASTVFQIVRRERRGLVVDTELNEVKDILTRLISESVQKV
jgi:PrgI family protein